MAQLSGCARGPFCANIKTSTAFPAPNARVFLQNGRIRHVVEFPGLSDEEAVKGAKALFAEWSAIYDSFEVWERTRRVKWSGRISRRKKTHAGRNNLASQAQLSHKT